MNGVLGGSYGVVNCGSLSFTVCYYVFMVRFKSTIYISGDGGQLFLIWVYTLNLRGEENGGEPGSEGWLRNRDTQTCNA